MSVLPAPGERVRVAHVITMLELGGAQQNTLHTVRHLDRRRFAVALVCGPGGYLDGEARSIPELDLAFVPELVREVRPRHDLQALLALRRIFAATRPHVVHTHSSKAGILGRRKQGTHTLYAIADETVLALCEEVCGGLQRQFSELAELVGGPRR